MYIYGEEGVFVFIISSQKKKQTVKVWSNQASTV